MADKFLGAWLVTEYVFTPAGVYLGHIRQRRELRQLANGAIRVLQVCEPEARLAEHPMGRFAGEWIFDLTVAGRQRLYHGPAVIGSGRTWGEGIMLGEGLWPDFGYNFHSFSVLAAPERQLTGGKFFAANEMIANIVGVAVPEADGVSWPTLALSPASFTFAGQGEQVVTDAAGVSTRRALERQIVADGHIRDGDLLSLVWAAEVDRFVVTGVGPAGEQLQGLAKRYGPMREAILYGTPGEMIAQMEIVDEVSGRAITLRHWRQNHSSARVETVRWSLTASASGCCAR